MTVGIAHHHRVWRWSTIGGPLAVALSATVGAITVAVIDPSEPGHYPLCPFRVVTGLDCPGCGSLRAIHAVLHGDVVGALGFNALAVVALPFVVYGWWRWTLLRTGRSLRPLTLGDPRWIQLIGAVIVAFTIVRNSPWGAALAP